IDTEGSFHAERAKEIAEGLIEHLNVIGKLPQHKDNADSQSALRKCTVESILRGLHVYRVFDVTEQLAVVHSLPSFVSTRNIKFIALDSIAFHFRRGFSDMGERSRILAAHAKKLAAIAEQRDIAVVVVNQATTKIDRRKTAGADGERERDRE